MIDPRPVGYVVGWLVGFLGVLMLAPMALDLADGNANFRAFALSALLAATLGAALTLACAPGWHGRFSLRQGFLLTSAVWGSFILVSTLPLMLGAPGLGPTRAIFEATSALTTSGGTVITGLDSIPRGVLLWRGLLTWVGGIGIVLVALLLLPALNIGGMQLLRSGDFNTLGKIMPRAKQIALSCGLVYLGLTLACTLAYSWAGMEAFHAVVLGMSTVATGGMANHDDSFAGFTPAVQYIALVFMLLGALSFVRFVQVARGDPGALLRDSQVRAFLAIYLGFCLAMVAARTLLGGETLSPSLLREVFFNMASVITTTGFASTDYGDWGSLADSLFFCAMMICGCSGSTSGGPKVFRYQLLVADLAAEIRRLYSPRRVVTPRYEGEPVPDEVINSVMAYFMLYFLTLGLGAVGLVLLGLDPLTAISGSAANLSTVGAGLGPVIGPAGNYASLPDPALWLLSFLMLAGRLELMALYVLFTPAYWRA
ncbi:MAG: TrkH family potassium uptake protein [Amaricoccus sp.]